MGTSWDRLIASWKKLKNNLNWLKSTTGRKFSTLYFWLLTALEIVLWGSVLPSNHTFRYTRMSSFPQHPHAKHLRNCIQQLSLREKTEAGWAIPASELLSCRKVLGTSPSSEPSSEGFRSCSSNCFSGISFWSMAMWLEIYAWWMSLFE